LEFASYLIEFYGINKGSIFMKTIDQGQGEKSRLFCVLFLKAVLFYFETMFCFDLAF